MKRKIIIIERKVLIYVLLSSTIISVLNSSTRKEGLMGNTEGTMTIAELRRKRDKTQQEMADLINVSLPTYRNKEKGLVEFSLSEARKICEELGYPLADILD